jgi:hypothetical protein
MIAKIKIYYLGENKLLSPDASYCSSFVSILDLNIQQVGPAGRNFTSLPTSVHFNPN